jgi:putative tryptophan/tyrosine transport system substrate-binding protein
VNKRIFQLSLCSLRLAVLRRRQARNVSRIGLLSAVSPAAVSARVEAFRQGLRERGYVEGKNSVTEYRYAEGKLDRLPGFAAELARLKVDVIVTDGPASTRPAKEATSTIAIVMAQESDPVGSGFVASLAQPGGKHHRLIYPFPGAKRQTT